MLLVSSGLESLASGSERNRHGSYFTAAEASRAADVILAIAS